MAKTLRLSFAIIGTRLILRLIFLAATGGLHNKERLRHPPLRHKGEGQTVSRENTPNVSE
jgi:hypothetical protein